MKYWAFLLVLVLVCGLLVACQSRAALVSPTQAQGPDASARPNGPVLLPTATDVPSPTPTLLPLSPGSSASLSPTTDPALVAWQTLPIAPTEINPRVCEIYRLSLELGNNPNAFSNIGDCDATTTWFLSDFDLGPQYYSLGEYGYLQAMIDAFHGSFSRQSIAVLTWLYSRFRLDASLGRPGPVQA
jgi:hypothetical protein